MVVIQFIQNSKKNNFYKHIKILYSKRNFFIIILLFIYFSLLLLKTC